MKQKYMLRGKRISRRLPASVNKPIQSSYYGSPNKKITVHVEATVSAGPDNIIGTDDDVITINDREIEVDLPAIPSKEELEEMHMKDLRKLGAEYGVKDRSRVGLLEKILALK